MARSDPVNAFGLRHPASIALTVALMVGAVLHALLFMLRTGG
jgi:hypothetical protein